MKAKSITPVFRLFSLFVVMALAFSLTTPAFAEGEVPTETPAPTETAPVEGGGAQPTEEPVATEAPPSEEVEPTEPAPTEAPLVEETPLEQAPTEAAPELGELVETLDESGAVLLDEGGAEVPLASEQAVELLDSADPWFSVGGKIYRFLGPAGACALPENAAFYCEDNLTATGLQNPLQRALNYIQAMGTIPDDKQVHLEAAAFTSDEVLIDGSNANIAKLTGIIGAGSGVTTFTGTSAFIIQNMPGAFTLSGMTINRTSGTAKPVIDFNNIGGTIKLTDVKVSNTTAGQGIRIQNHRGSVEINDVRVENTGGTAALIDNTAGVGNVTIKNSDFIDGSNGGMVISTKGTVLLDGVSAIGNVGSGAYITAGKGVTVKNSWFTLNTTGSGLYISSSTSGNVVLNWVYAINNSYNGIIAYTLSGSITASNITTLSNGYHGITFDTCVWDGSKCTGNPSTSNISLTNSYHEQGADYQQVALYALGNVVVTNIEVYSGDSSGLYIDNKYATSAKNVTITKAILSSNDGTNLFVYSKGQITLDGVAASYSTDGSGMILDNTYGTAGVVFKNAAGQNKAYMNYQYGIDLDTNGAVTISGLEVSNSQMQYGMDIQAKGKVSISGTAALPTFFNNNNTYGLSVHTNGEIVLSYVEGNTNFDGNGIYLANDTGTANVSGKFSEASNNDGSGLMVYTKGSITLTSVTANDNEEYGALLDNNTVIKPVTLNGTASAPNAFNNNYFTGLHLNTKGSVILKEVSAAGNSSRSRTAIFGKFYQDALYDGQADRWYFAGATGYVVTIQAHSAFFNPIIRLFSPTGAVLSTSVESGSDASLTYTLASGSGTYSFNIYNGEIGGYDIKLTRTGVPYDDSMRQDSQSRGIYINNQANPSSTVTITNTGVDSGQFIGNGARGLEIYTTKNLSITKADSSYGGAGGAILTSSNGSATLKTVRFDRNPSHGAWVNAVSINILGVNASYNLGSGLSLNSSGTITVAAPKDTLAYFGSNTGHGVEVSTQGAVTLTNLYASFNTRGFDVSTNGNVSVVGSLGYYNDQQGFYIRTQGTISMKGITTYDNGGTGVELNNTLSDVNRGVTLTDLSLDSDDDTGLAVASNGPINLKNVNSASNTNWYCIYLDNDSASSNAPVTYSGGSVDSCGFSGVYIRTKGAVTLTNILAEDASVDGIDIYNKNSPTNAKVTLTGITVDGNVGMGLTVTTNGAILITNLTASQNQSGTYAIFLSNGTSPINAGVTIKSTSGKVNEINYSTGTGLRIQTNGPVILDKVISKNSSGGSGASISTLGNLTITNSSFDGNRQYGVNGTVGGSLLINNTTANWNMDDDGMFITMTNDKPATITRSTFNYNDDGNGLTLYVNGTTLLNKVTCFRNAYGAYISNTNSNTPRMVTITNSMGMNDFSNNTDGYGLQVRNYGPVTLKGITANDNLEIGVMVYTYNESAASHTTADLITATGNGDTGIYISNSTTGSTTARGNITVQNSIAFNNGTGFVGDGMTLRTGGNVTVKNSAAVGNHGNGLDIDVNLGVSLVTLSNVAYGGNDVNNAPGGQPNLYIH